MFFWKQSKGGWGVIFDPKNSIADFLYSKRYILVLNVGENVRKGGEGGASPIQKISLQIYASYRIFTNFRKKKRNVISKNGGGVKGRLEFFQKNIHFGKSERP